MIYLQYQFYLVKLKGNCTRSHKQSTLPLTTSRQDEECTIQQKKNHRTCKYKNSTSDVSTHVHVTQRTCTKAVHVSTHVHVTQNVHVSTIKNYS